MRFEHRWSENLIEVEWSASPGTRRCVSLVATDFIMRTFTAVLALTLASSCGAAQVFDDFEGGANPNGWEFNDGATLVPSGGHPGAWLDSGEFFAESAVFTSVPLHSAPLGVALASGRLTSISFDFQRLALVCEQPGGADHFVLILTARHGTVDHDDDDYAYVTGDAVPQNVGEWVHVAFPIPSGSADLPPGWTGGHRDDSTHFRPGVTWADLMASADEIDVAEDLPFEAHFQGCWHSGLDSVEVDYTEDSVFADGFEAAP